MSLKKPTPSGKRPKAGTSGSPKTSGKGTPRKKQYGQSVIPKKP